MIIRLVRKEGPMRGPIGIMRNPSKAGEISSMLAELARMGSKEARRLIMQMPYRQAHKGRLLSLLAQYRAEREEDLVERLQRYYRFKSVVEHRRHDGVPGLEAAREECRLKFEELLYEYGLEWISEASERAGLKVI
jgi:hypothetical protein